MNELNAKLLKTFTSDGFELDAFLCEHPKSDKIVLHFHGKEGDFLQNHFLQAMPEAFAKKGYSFMSASHRGRSYMADLIRKSAAGFEFVQKGAAFDIFEDCIYDIDAWVKVLEARGYKTIILQQHSTPQKILYYMLKKPSKSVKALVLVSPSDMLYLFERYVENYPASLQVAEKLIKDGRENQLMPVTLWSNCPVSAKVFYNWGNPKSNILVFNYAHPEKGFNYFPKITLPMLAVLAENDIAVGNQAQECLDMLKNNTGSKDFATKVIMGTGHSYLGKEEELANSIGNWLKF